MIRPNIFIILTIAYLYALSSRKPIGLEKMGLVYRIPCSQCDWSYVGETGRTLQERVGEHRRTVRNWNTSSEIANHVLNDDHQMEWNSASVLSLETNRFKRVFKESVFSQFYKSGNRVFFDADAAWSDLL